MLFFRPFLLILCLALPISASLASTDNSPAKDSAWTGEPREKPKAKMKTADAAPAPEPSQTTPSPSRTTASNSSSASSSLSVSPSMPPAPPPTPTQSETKNQIATLSVDDLKEYATCSDAVKQLISQGLALTKLNLAYRYGSSDPKNGGMDCSGTVYYLLKQAGLDDVPRDASEMYKWVWTHSRFQAVVSSNPATFELDGLQPGDLLFWTGTYHVDRDPPVTHVMIYLGHNRQNGHRVMLGASEGRTFENKARYGVSVFDFLLPRTTSSTTLPARFIGYGAVPGLEKAFSAAIQ